MTGIVDLSVVCAVPSLYLVQVEATAFQPDALKIMFDAQYQLDSPFMSASPDYMIEINGCFCASDISCRCVQSRKPGDMRRLAP